MAYLDKGKLRTIVEKSARETQEVSGIAVSPSTVRFVKAQLHKAQAKGTVRTSDEHELCATALFLGGAKMSSDRNLPRVTVDSVKRAWNEILCIAKPSFQEGIIGQQQRRRRPLSIPQPIVPVGCSTSGSVIMCARRSIIDRPLYLAKALPGFKTLRGDK